MLTPSSLSALCLAETNKTQDTLIFSHPSLLQSKSGYLSIFVQSTNIACFFTDQRFLDL